MNRCCKLVANDINGDSVMDYKDQWGMLGSGNIAITFMWSCGGMFGNINSSGEVDFTLDDETNINALNKSYDFFSQRDLVLDANRIPAITSTIVSMKNAIASAYEKMLEDVKNYES